MIFRFYEDEYYHLPICRGGGVIKWGGGGGGGGIENQSIHRLKTKNYNREFGKIIQKTEFTPTPTIRQVRIVKLHNIGRISAKLQK